MLTQPDGAPGDAPNIDIRRQMVDFALQGNKFKAVVDRHANPKTAEEQAIRRLEMLTKTIFDTCAEVKRLSINQGQPYDEAAMQKLAMSMWRDALTAEGHDNLLFLSTIVLTGFMLEKLDEVC